jgi:RNA polymerase sigma-70 factor (ECF subfamily)
MMPPGELEQVYERHGAALFAFVLNFTRNEPDTRDLLQEIFRRLAAHPNPLKGVRQERPFLLRLAHNLAVDTIRRRAARERTAETMAAEVTEVFAPTDDPDEQAFRIELAEALAKLPPDQRAVVHLKLWEELTLEQIAETLGIPANTAASRYRYGLDKLRSKLRPLYDEIR